MLYLEFNWTAGTYQARFGDTFTDIRGVRSWGSLADAKADLATAGLMLGRKTDSRSWRIESTALLDQRYSINREFYGGESAAFVLRFTGEFIGAFETRGDAESRQVEHWNERQAELVR